MPQFVLSEKQKKLLRKYGEDFKTWIEGEKGRYDVTTHRDHERYFKERLSERNLDKMTGSEFAEIYKKLWASSMWTNKDWYIQNRLIAPNGLEKIKAELKKLLYSENEEIISRYDQFRASLRGFGNSSISEILHFMFPKKFCLWNDKPKTVLPFLELTELPEKFFKYQLSSGADYHLCVEYLLVIKDELAPSGIRDFIDLDIFFWYIFDDVIPQHTRRSTISEKGSVVKQSKQEQLLLQHRPKIIIDSHEGAEYYLLQLGNMLGYLSYTVDQSKTFDGKKLGEAALLKEIPAFAGERDLNSARNIDVIWFGDDENPKLCFEVEHTTDIVNGLNRLAQIKHLYVNFFIVAVEDRRNKFENEMRKYPFRTMKERFRFISYDELAALYQATVPFYELRTKLLREE